MQPIHHISLPGGFPISPPWSKGPAQAPQVSFGEVLSNSIEHVNNVQHQANQSVEALLTGGDVNTAEVFTAVQQADMSFRMMLQIRNKLVEAYQQIQNLQI